MAAEAKTCDGNTTALEVIEAFSVNLEGQVVFITGTSSGIGIETARAMLTAGATVVGAVRNLEKMAPIAEELKTSTGNDKLEILQCDLASLASVRACAAAFREKYTKLNIMICNAGVMATNGRRETADGFEFQFGVCHLGHFLLVSLIADLMFDIEGGSRLVSLSSQGHKFGGIDFEDMQLAKEPYNKWRAYGQAKTANILFAREFNTRYAGRGCTGFSVHPGLIQTSLGRELTQEDYAIFQNMPGEMKVKTIPQGAATTVFAAVSPTIGPDQGGSFLADCSIASEVLAADVSFEEGFRRHAVATHIGTTDNDAPLWNTSQELVGQTFPASA